MEKDCPEDSPRIPLKVFSYPDTLFTDLMDWMTLLFWTFNVPATLTVGYTSKGDTVMEPNLG